MQKPSSPRLLRARFDASKSAVEPAHRSLQKPSTVPYPSRGPRLASGGQKRFTFMHHGESSVRHRRIRKDFFCFQVGLHTASTRGSRIAHRSQRPPVAPHTAPCQPGARLRHREPPREVSIGPRMPDRAIVVSMPSAPRGAEPAPWPLLRRLFPKGTSARDRRCHRRRSRWQRPSLPCPPVFGRKSSS